MSPPLSLLDAEPVEPAVSGGAGRILLVLRVIGAPPKRYARILRFRRVLSLLQSGAAPLADLALDAGYYDQPHMNAEFRELSGFSPREFLAARRYPGSVSLAEAGV